MCFVFPTFWLLFGFLSVVVAVSHGYQILQLRECNGSTIMVNLDMSTAVVVNLSVVDPIPHHLFCSLSFSAKGLSIHNLFIVTLQLFDINPLSKSSIHSTIYFSSIKTNFFMINLQDKDVKIKNMFLTGFLLERNFKWEENLNVVFKIKSPSVTNIILVVTPAFFCANIQEKDKFKCQEDNRNSRICIDNQYKCNGWTNCINSNIDESNVICQSQFVYHILLPSVILSCTVFVLGWMLLKVTPCLLQQRRLFMLRRNRTMLHNPTNIFNSLSSSSYFQENGLGYTNSEVNITPDNIPQSPPKYHNIYQTNMVEHHLPPTYSEETEIGVFPKFFKKFFGRHQVVKNIENKKSDNPRKALDSQSDHIHDEVRKISEDSFESPDSLTSVTLTDINWTFSPL